jgi:hypothetical protein
MNGNTVSVNDMIRAYIFRLDVTVRLLWEISYISNVCEFLYDLVVLYLFWYVHMGYSEPEG